jgi:HEAT repeat protein
MSNRLATRDPERAMEIVQYILKQEKAFRDENQVRFFLGAVANSGNPAAYETILPYLGSADDLTRIEAVAAMGRMPQEEAIPHLAQAMSDKSAAVRISAIQAAQARSAHSGLPGKVKNLLRNDPDSNVRKEALNYLVTTSSDPGVLRALLQQVASSDPDPDLRKAAMEAMEAQ